MDDFYTDSGALFARIFNDHELPDFAQTGQEQTLEKLAAFPEDAFADKIARRLPIHDRAHCFVSAAYCYAQPWEKDAVAHLAEIEKRAAFFGISDSLAPLKAHVEGLVKEPVQKEASAYLPFSIEVRVDHGTRLFKGRGKTAAAQTQDRFLDLLSKVAFADRTNVAAEVLDACEKAGAEPREELLKVAGRAMCDEKKYAEQVALRLSLVMDSLAKSAASHAIELPAADLSARVTALQAMDSEHKLARFYGERLLDPHQAVYNTVPKKAEILQIGPSAYPMGRWSGMTGDFYKGLEAALGHEKAASLVDAETGKPDLAKCAALTEQEAALASRYLG